MPADGKEFERVVRQGCSIAQRAKSITTYMTNYPFVLEYTEKKGQIEGETNNVEHRQLEGMGVAEYVADEMSAQEFERKKVRIKPELRSQEQEHA